MTFSITTLGITTFSIMTHSIKGLFESLGIKGEFVTISINDIQHNAVCTLWQKPL
jgi:hypothetical protein